jgi:hypothetical protein
MVEVHIGETLVPEILMRDRRGNIVTRYHISGKVSYSSTNINAVSTVDENASLPDVQWRVLQAAAEPAYLSISFAGNTGEGIRMIALQSEPIQVVEGEATEDAIVVHLEPVIF